MTLKAADVLGAAPRFTPDELVLEWPNQTFTVYRAQWLRDNDPAHRDPRNGQRLISLIDLPEEPRIQAVDPSPPGEVTVHWEDGACSIFSLQWLRAIDRERRARARPMRMPWMGQPAESFAWCDYAAWMAQPTARADWLERVARDGMAFLRQVPREDQALLTVAAHIGHVRETNYGRVFDVRSVARPNNLAYTTLGLRVHTDGPYRDPVPGLQMLHCLTAAGEGGESLFVDGLAAAERLRTRDPEDFATLSQTLIRFRFQEDAVDLCAERTMIDVDPQGQFRAIYYNDRAIAPLFLAPPLLKRYYAAYRRLATLLQERARYVTYRLQPGDLVLFDNTRILHGRTAFSAGEHDAPGASRHLQGCYIDADGFYSALAILTRKGETR
jgi:gamma-butyrobetaine dioxygenase